MVDHLIGHIVGESLSYTLTLLIRLDIIPQNSAEESQRRLHEQGNDNWIPCPIGFELILDNHEIENAQNRHPQPTACCSGHTANNTDQDTPGENDEYVIA